MVRQRFSDWAQTKAEKTFLGEKQELPYLVDNTELPTASRGVRFRMSPNLEDKDYKRRAAPFGSVVRGTLSDDGEWLKVGKRWLPINVNGKNVLMRVWTDGFEAEEEVVSNSEDERADNFAKEQRKWNSIESPPATRPLDPGKGALYEVIADRVFIRAAPGLQARTCGTRTKNQVIEVFDWDATRCWRRTLCARTMVEGWMLLDHPELGPLARPKGVPFSVRPLEPLVVAAREGAVEDVQRFVAEDEGQGLSEVRDVDGRSPLLAAAEEGHLHCCLVLLEGGARLSESEVSKLGSDSRCRALIEAVAGRDFETRILDEGLAGLPEDAQQLADRLIEACVASAYTADVAKEEDMSRGKSSHSKQEVIRILQESGDSRHPPLSGADPGMSPPTAQSKSAMQALASEKPPPPAQQASLAAGQRLAKMDYDTLVPNPRGTVHEVIHKAVFIRAEPVTAGPPVSSLKLGNRVDVVEYDKSLQWGRVEVQKPQGVISGWVALTHPDIGTLLRPC